jgi:hypothetical protein
MAKPPPRDTSIPAGILAALEQAADGMTPGELRTHLLGSAEGKQCLAALSGSARPAPASLLQAAAYDWWKQREIIVEPPRPGKNAVRLWHPERVPAAWKPAKAEGSPASPASAGAGTGTVTSQLHANSTAGEQKLMVEVTQLLASTWKRSPHEMAKRTLQSILHNLGVQRIGAAGQRVPFQPQHQELDEPSSADLEPGAPVEVVEPGWILQNCPGDYLLAKAKVTIPSS